jgi:hypothetical protein
MAIVVEDHDGKDIVPPIIYLIPPEDNVQSTIAIA